MSVARGVEAARKAAGRLKAPVGRAVLPTDAVAWCERYQPFPLSPAWRAFIIALYGLTDRVTLEVRESLHAICRLVTPNAGGYREAVVIAGRRGGKSAVNATLAVFECLVNGPAHMVHLAPGQRGHFFVVSRTARQALETFRYARGIVEHHPELHDLLESEPLESKDGGKLRFANGVVLSVIPASKGGVRGFTVIGAICDEFCWLPSDDESADQDVEIVAALRFAMVAPVGAPVRRLLVVSSPAGRSGYAYKTFTENHGQPDAPVLAAHGPTWLWNPTIDLELLEEERRRDPKRFAREVLAEFADAISAWIDAVVVEAAVGARDGTPLKPIIVPLHLRATDGAGPTYVAAVDIGLKRDNSVLAIGHLMTDGHVVVDGVWTWTPTPGEPLDLSAVVVEMAKHCKEYGADEITGDQYCSIPVGAEFALQGLTFTEVTSTNPVKLEFFTRLREAFYAKKVSLPAHETLLRELRELQERLTTSGNVVIGHPARGTAHDDHASAVCWLHASLAKPRAFVGSDPRPWMDMNLQRR